MKYQSAIRFDDYMDGTTLFLRKVADNGDIYNAQPLKWEKQVGAFIINPVEVVAEPDTRELLQCLVNEAWDKGIRPQQATSEVLRTDLENHLADMRKIALHKLNIK